MTKEDRVKNAASKKKGRNITILERVNGAESTFVVLAGENDGLRTRKDVKDWMSENDYIGTVYPCRLDKCITRAEQIKHKFSEGEE